MLQQTIGGETDGLLAAQVRVRAGRHTDGGAIETMELFAVQIGLRAR